MVYFGNMYIVGFRITWTLLSCRRELRFPTITAFRRDSEIAPTEFVAIRRSLLQNSSRFGDRSYRIRRDSEIAPTEFVAIRRSLLQNSSRFGDRSYRIRRDSEIAPTEFVAIRRSLLQNSCKLIFIIYYICFIF